MKRLLRVVPVLALILMVVNIAPRSSTPALAAGSNIVLTGHDMDYHCYYGDPNECAYLKIVLNLVRNGSTLPVLVLDQGGEVAGAISAAYGPGVVPVVVVDPTTPAWNSTALVDPTGKPLYSALVTASDSTCGGCDDDPTGEAAINARSSAIKTFFNAGGGILALAGANNYATYYNFVPVTASGASVTYPFTPTPYGQSLGITNAMANCCATHNSFSLPSSGSALQVAETDGAGIAETLIGQGVLIGGGGFTKDTTPPTCAVTGTTKNYLGQTTGIQVTIQDSDGGLQATPGGTYTTAPSPAGGIKLTQVGNASVAIPRVAAGTTSPVVVTATKTNPATSAAVSLVGTDTGGNTTGTSCDPVITNPIREAGKPVTQSVLGVERIDHLVTVFNDTPGVSAILVTVNGQNFKLAGLHNEQRAGLDIGSALHDGTNAVTLTLFGPPGGSATVLFGTM